MSALETYAKQALAMKGTDHMHAIQSLRRYMNITPEEELIKYINMMTDKEILRTLLEAGMRGDTWKTVVSRIGQLFTGQAGGAP
ncbi:hypothetical protein KKE60_08165 [Patescibacteria group bacterium]|nr:hypothetical protein [Patescibacteria group bacterium]